LKFPKVFADGVTADECVAETRKAMQGVVAFLIESGKSPPAPAREGARHQQVNVRLTSEGGCCLNRRLAEKDSRGCPISFARRRPTRPRSSSFAHIAKGFNMASLFRPTVIRYVNAQGRQIPKGAPGAKRVREKSKTYRGRYRTAGGKIRTVSLSDDHDAAETMLGELVKRAKRKASGDIDPFEDHRKRPLTEHLEDFEAALLAKAATNK
jgi:predicted RNase H-like HicB family nuclease